jgi:hypothetical protein
MTNKNKKKNPNSIHANDIVEILRGNDFFGVSIAGRQAKIINPWVSASMVCLRVDGMENDIFFLRKDIRKIGGLNDRL